MTPKALASSLAFLATMVRSFPVLPQGISDVETDFVPPKEEALKLSRLKELEGN